MDLVDWERSVPADLRKDRLWQMRVYRLALYAADRSWSDITRLASDRRTAAIADQLYRALGSIGANIAEGYSRASRRDQARFYEYALGSCRESRDWYFKARHVLSDQIVVERLSTLTEITRLLLTIIPAQRS